MPYSNPEIADLATRYGIVFDGAIDFLSRSEMAGRTGADRHGGFDPDKLRLAMDAAFAYDAPSYNQQPLVTNPNGGIPAFLTTYLDPKLIDVLLAPIKAEEVYGSRKMGDFTTQTAMFAMIERTGEAAAYDDYAETGMSGINWQYPQRQSFNFQTITETGDLETERADLGKVNLVAQKNISSANTLRRFYNLTGFFGVAGLQNYGGLNDPNLSAALTPATKTAGGTGWQKALPTEILADVQAMYAQIVTQVVGNVELDSPMTLALHPVTQAWLMNTNSFGLSAMALIRPVFPRLKVVTAVQYLSGAGIYSAQLIVDEIEGQRTAETAFNERMRAGRVIMALSSMKQKKSAGTWGTVIYRPIGIVSMAGL